MIDLATGVRETIQTDTARSLIVGEAGVDKLWFGSDPSLIVVADELGNVHILRCSICAPDDALLSSARSTLTWLSRFKRNIPPVHLLAAK